MEFTIKETFAYFGRLLKLKSDLVASRQAELLHLLQLGDEENRQVELDILYASPSSSHVYDFHSGV